MKKNEYEEHKALLEWMKELEPEELPKRVEKKIHRKVIKKIRADQQIEKKHLKVHKCAIAAASVLVIVSGVPMVMYAASNQHLFGVFVDDKRMEEYAETEKIVGIPADDASKLDVPERIIDSQIVNENSFGDIDYYSSIVDAEIKESIPEMVMGQSAMIIFKTSKTDGWFLKKGETLEVKYNIDGTYNYGDGTGEAMIFGYVADGKYYEVDSKKDINFTFRLEAPKDGIYYPTIQNSAIGYIKITDGQVNVR